MPESSDARWASWSASASLLRWLRGVLPYRGRDAAKIGVTIAARTHAALFCLALFLSFSAESAESGDDSRLAESEIIVVAKWASENQERHRMLAWNAKLGRVDTLKKEVFTTIEILRVIRGDVPLGKTRIITAENLIFQGIGKNGVYRLVKQIDRDRKEMRGLLGRSRGVVGKAENVRVPCIWFLSVGKSWQDGKPYPVLATPVAIQPLKEEARFLKLIKDVEPGK